MFRTIHFLLAASIGLLMISFISSTPSPTTAQELDPQCLGKDEAFLPYADTLHIYCDETFMYIESENLADHDMMIGITAWNQQVVLPQHFDEDNPWMIPLHPVLAEEPSPTTGQGPIAIAINGVMIYNPTQQDGIYDEDHDPNLIGELDICGGHAGRADDYHYHVAPNCILEELAEDGDPSQPIAYAMDGFPIYGFTNPDGSTPILDECGGEVGENGDYHYHANPDYPYVNGCFSGEVDLSLQPRTHPIRPAGEPIHVLITDFYEDDDGWIHLEYDYEGSTHAINYREDEEGCYVFEFEDAAESHIETYWGDMIQDGQAPPDGNPPPRNGNGDNPPPRDGSPPPPRQN